MKNALPPSLALLMLCALFTFASCSTPDSPPATPAAATSTDAISSIASAFAAPSDQAPPAPTAEIMDIVQGTGGNWAVAVRLGDGSGPCQVEIYDRRTSKLLTRETLQPAESGKIQEIQFSHRGNRDSLAVKVTDQKSGNTLADWAP